MQGWDVERSPLYGLDIFAHIIILASVDNEGSYSITYIFTCRVASVIYTVFTIDQNNNTYFKTIGIIVGYPYN